MSLPKDFLWGGAVAAHQLEGGLECGRKGRQCIHAPCLLLLFTGIQVDPTPIVGERAAEAAHSLHFSAPMPAALCTLR